MSKLSLDAHFTLINRLLQHHPTAISGVEWREEDHASWKLRTFKVHFKGGNENVVKTEENSDDEDGDKEEEEEEEDATSPSPTAPKPKKNRKPLFQILLM